MDSGSQEMRRLAYLEALGVDTYVSRGQLPGAAPTLRLAIVPPAAARAVGELIGVQRPVTLAHHRCRDWIADQACQVIAAGQRGRRNGCYPGCVG